MHRSHTRSHESNYKILFSTKPTCKSHIIADNQHQLGKVHRNRNYELITYRKHLLCTSPARQPSSKEESTMHLYPISSPSWPKRELPLMKDRLRITQETELAIREHKEHNVQKYLNRWLQSICSLTHLTLIVPNFQYVPAWHGDGQVQSSTHIFSTEWCSGHRRTKNISYHQVSYGIGNTKINM
jgi:hypothetical protein